MFGTFGATEILVIVLLFVLFFGASRIPVIARGLGEGIRNFRSSVREGGEDDGRRLPGGGGSGHE